MRILLAPHTQSVFSSAASHWQRVGSLTAPPSWNIASNNVLPGWYLPLRTRQSPRVVLKGCQHTQLQKVWGCFYHVSDCTCLSDRCPQFYLMLMIHFVCSLSLNIPTVVFWVSYLPPPIVFFFFLNVILFKGALCCFLGGRHVNQKRFQPE